jgi:DNA-binding beta-propeller fold protein YncE
MEERMTRVGSPGFQACVAAVAFALLFVVVQAPFAQGNVPVLEVDPFWPKMPEKIILGPVRGVAVDAQDHVWIAQDGSGLSADMRGAAANPPQAECCMPGPPVMEFDANGNYIKGWGGPGQGYDWPQQIHGLFIDYKGNLWVSSERAGDNHILKFNRDGKFLLQIGKPGQSTGNNDKVNVNRAADMHVHPKTNELFVADGYGNRRVAVIDMTSGAIKRFWGAYGNAPADTSLGPYDPDAPPAPQFRNPVHCAEPARDGLIYVCDRPNNRIQVFRRDGTFVNEVFIAPRTLGDGAVWDIAFSHDPAQRFLYLADGKNMRIYVLDRQTLEVLTEFGGGGRQPGQFFAVHSIATDSKGNIYTTETYEGKRVQKFLFRGIGQVPARQGVVWPVR